MAETSANRKGRGRKVSDDGGQDNNRWLITYADAITLLLVFFIILYAISESDKKKFISFAAAVENAFSVFGLGGGEKPGLSPEQGNASNQDFTIFDNEGSSPNAGEKGDKGQGQKTELIDQPEKEMTAMERMKAKRARIAQTVVKKIKKRTGENAWMEIRDNEIHIIIADKVLFDRRCTHLTTSGRDVLRTAADSLHELQGPIRVEGHTLKVRPKEPRYENNWDLSCGKAILVVNYLSAKRIISGNRLSILGCGQYSPSSKSTAPSDPRNARIEIVVPLEWTPSPKMAKTNGLL